jgi:alpha-L-arabinofuranosidase
MATKTDASARLVIAGKAWLDMVSLFPADAVHGFRPDLLAMLKAMQPAFVRFPGGCYVEGDKLEEAFRWKKTIGDIAARPGHWNLWNYRSTDGLGYHEYLQLCEDLGAAPLFVINCGMSHEEQRKQTGPPANEYVQDALDAIEYANGPVYSRWGALRAQAGHPAPFNLRYMEIGNENGGPMYHAHYALFHDAIKARYPAMTLIANDWQGLPKNRPLDMIDSHAYTAPAAMCNMSTRYDHASRTGPKVYFGEYAVTEQAGRGNLQAAVAEAAFMTGLERNGDLVAMASYAPLFECVGYQKWNPNAIVFDDSRAYGIPSYYVQAMFAVNRVDRVLPVTLRASVPSLYAVAGRVDKTGETILKIVNAGNEPVETTIELRGAKPGLRQGRAWVLGDADPLAENSFAAPTRIAPHAEPVEVTGPSFNRTFPAHSVAVLRF